jgi:hypothetical protein
VKTSVVMDCDFDVVPEINVAVLMGLLLATVR